MSRKLKVAVTGGMGSGKSLVCDILEEKGYPIIRADVLGKELLKNDEEVRRKVIEYFGENSYKDNVPNRQFLAEQVFSDKEKVKIINSIIHPKTIRIIENEMASFLRNSDIVFVESALVFEAKRVDNFDYIVLVYSEDEIKIKRIIERDSISRESILSRMEHQIPDSRKKEMADFTIINNGTIDELKERINFFLTILSNI